MPRPPLTPDPVPRDEPVLRLSDVHRSLGRGRSRTPVLRGVDLTARAGAVTVLLGPNGAGKTSLLKTCAGLLRPRGGRVATHEHEAATPQELAEAVALMPQQITAVPRLSCREQVAYAGWLAGLPTSEAEQRADGALVAVGLTDQAATRSKALSGGQLRRLGLAESLVRRTGVLLLDEPTAGMDAGARSQFWQSMRRQSEQGRTIIFATHYLKEAEEFAERIVLMHEGEIIADGTTAPLDAQTGDPKGMPMVQCEATVPEPTS